VKTYQYSLLLIVLLCQCAPKAIYKSEWQPEKIIADGDISDWSAPTIYYDKATKLKHEIRNDAENLYLTLSTSNDQTQMKILMAGLQVWIDTTGGNKKHIGIIYPVGKSMEQSEAMGLLASQDHDAKSSFISKKKLIALQTQLIFSQLHGPNNEVLPTHNTGGINVAIDMNDNGEMIYEAVIPFYLFLKSPFRSAMPKIVALSVKVNGLPRTEIPQDMVGMPSGSPPSGVPAGGPPGGGVFGGRGSMPDMSIFQSSSFSIKFLLSKN
jgi:hypothetical protein